MHRKEGSRESGLGAYRTNLPRENKEPETHHEAIRVRTGCPSFARPESTVGPHRKTSPSRRTLPASGTTMLCKEASRNVIHLGRLASCSCFSATCLRLLGYTFCKSVDVLVEQCKS